MQSIPLDAVNFLTKFGEIMSEITRAEVLYGTDLKKVSRELSGLYWRWMKDLMLRKPISKSYWDELRRVEFTVYKTICEDIIKRSSDLVVDLDRLFFVETSELSVAIDEASRQKVKIESSFIEERTHEKGIQSMKDAIDGIFKVYSDWKATKRHKERNALKKWGGVLGTVYSLIMVIYFAILNFMQTTPDFTLGVVIPVGVALFMILLLIAIFSRE